MQSRHIHLTAASFLGRESPCPSNRSPVAADREIPCTDKQPIFNPASLVGFGAVIASLPAFGLIRDAVLEIATGNPLISLSIAVNILAGITGSASGGMSVALQSLATDYLELVRNAGIAPE